MFACAISPARARGNTTQGHFGEALKHSLRPVKAAEYRRGGARGPWYSGCAVWLPTYIDTDFFDWANLSIIKTKNKTILLEICSVGSQNVCT